MEPMKRENAAKREFEWSNWHLKPAFFHYHPMSVQSVTMPGASRLGGAAFIKGCQKGAGSRSGGGRRVGNAAIIYMKVDSQFKKSGDKDIVKAGAR